jgi:hypothetical protein
VDAKSKKGTVDYCDYLFQTWTPYEKTIALWKENFPNVFIGHFDDLRENPQIFFNEVCGFLGIDATVPIEQIDKQVNKGSGKKIPTEIADHLRSQYSAEIQHLADLGYCKNSQAWFRYGVE